MDIKDFCDRVLQFANKNATDFWSYEEICEAADAASIDLFNELLGTPEQYQPGRRVPVVAYGETQVINDMLSVFKDQYAFTTADTASGIITLPAAFVRFLSGYIYSTDATLGRAVKSYFPIVNEEELVDRLESTLIPVTSADPIGIMNKQKKIQLFPEDPADGKIFYLRRPVKPVVSYTVSSRVITYDSGASTQLEWDDAAINPLMMKTLSYLGASIGSADLFQFAEGKDTKGS